MRQIGKDDVKSIFGQIALHAVIDSQAAIELLAHGSEIDAVNNNSDTALDIAVRAGIEEVVKALRDGGASLNLRNKFGETPV